MKIPTLPVGTYTDKEGNLTHTGQIYFDNLNSQMQSNLSDDGFVIPSRTTSDINNIANSVTNSKPNGTIWYDSETNQFKAKVNGLVKIFTLS